MSQPQLKPEQHADNDRTAYYLHLGAKLTFVFENPVIGSATARTLPPSLRAYYDIRVGHSAQRHKLTSSDRHLLDLSDKLLRITDLLRLEGYGRVCQFFLCPSIAADDLDLDLFSFYEYSAWSGRSEAKYLNSEDIATLKVYRQLTLDDLAEAWQHVHQHRSQEKRD